MAVQDYELLLRVRADLQQALQGLGGLSTSLGEVDKQARTAGESADAATARIKAMVAATAQQAQVQESVRSINERAAQSIRGTIKAYDDQAASVQRTRAAVDAYRAASGKQAGTAAATASIAAQRAEMGKLAAQIDPTVAALAKLDAQEASLNALRKAGAVGIEDYKRFKAVIDQNRVAITGAGKALNTFSLNTSQSRLELGRLIKDISTGQFGRLEQTSLTLASQAGLFSVLFSPLGLAIGAVVGALGGFAIAMEKGYEEEEKLNAAIVTTGNYAGVTVGQVDQLAASMGRNASEVSKAREIMTGLIDTGKFTGQTLGEVGRAALNWSNLTGKSVKEVVAEFSKMADDPVTAVRKLDDQYHFLTTSIYEQIKALQDQGDQWGALQLAASTFANETGKRMDELRAHMSWWEKFSNSFSTDNGFTRLVNWAKNLGRPATELDKFNAALARYNTAYDFYKRSLTAGSSKAYQDQLFADAQKAYADLQAAQAAAKGAQEDAAGKGLQARLASDAVKADAGLDRLAASIDKAYGKKEKIKELNKYFEDLWAGADPDNPKLAGVQRIVDANGKAGFTGGLYDTLLADINKKPKGRSTRGAENAAASAHEQLIKLLNDEQGAIDPTAKAWATYNDKVQQANDLAEKSKKAKGADVTVINAQRDAVIAAAAAARDAALDKIAEKDRAAFEKLRDSLKDINGVSFGNAIAQLKQLKDELGNGTITPEEYKSTSESVLNANLPKLPQFKGADALVTGPFGELDKLDGQQKVLEDAYKAQLDALNQWHERTLHSDETFIAKENELYAKHSEELRKIEDARSRVMLAGITSSLAAGADAIKQGFGEQSKEYRAAFALSKAAAIAQATVNMYSDISKATVAGISPWDKAAYIAQAIGESMTIIGEIRAVTAGFSGGGYTGPGGINQPAGVVHKGEVVWSQEDIRRSGGVAVVEAMRKGYRGYADGGFVNSPAASLHDFPMPSTGPALPSQPQGQGGQHAPRGLRLITTLDPNAIKDYLNSSEGEEVIVQMLGRNRTAIKTLVGR